MRRRGFALVLALGLSTLLLVMGLGLMLTQRGSRTMANVLRSQVRSDNLAWAGIEDALAKLERDPEFPPSSSFQPRFSYGETLLAGGHYLVTVDVEYRPPPYQVVRLTSTGIDAAMGESGSRSTIYLELDVAEFQRGPVDPNVGPQSNPNLFKPILIEYRLEPTPP